MVKLLKLCGKKAHLCEGCGWNACGERACMPHQCLGMLGVAVHAVYSNTVTLCGISALVTSDGGEVVPSPQQ